MKLRELPYLLGLTQKPRVYWYEINTFDLSSEGQVSYAQWLHPGESEKEITQESVDELRKFLTAGDTAIDIGAHSGDSTIPLALAVGEKGGVFALEPNKYVYPVLEKNSQLNTDKTNIVPLMFAATPEDGEFEFEYSDAGFCNGGFHENISKWRHGHAFKLKVQGKNLASFLRDNYPESISKIRFIKTDAEGYDFSVLVSLSEIIRAQKPFIKAEIYKHASAAVRADLYNFLGQYGYTVYKVESDANLCGEKIGLTDLEKWRHFDIFCVPS